MFLPFLLFGTVWFWAALVLPFLLLIYLVENEKAGAALGTILITIAAFAAFGDPTFFKSLSVAQYAIAIGGYVVAGIVWGIVKWFFYVLRARDNYERVRNAFLENAVAFRRRTIRETAERAYYDGLARHTNGTQTEAKRLADAAEATAGPAPEGFDKELFKQYVARETSLNLAEIPPKAARNKGRIIFWMAYWPASAFWTLLNDPLTRLYEFLYRRLGVVFENISKAMFGKYSDELA